MPRIKTVHDPVRDTGLGAVPELFSDSFASAERLFQFDGRLGLHLLHSRADALVGQGAVHSPVVDHQPERGDDGEVPRVREVVGGQQGTPNTAGGEPLYRPSQDRMSRPAR